MSFLTTNNDCDHSSFRKDFRNRIATVRLTSAVEVIICSLYRLCWLPLAASHFTVPPRPSQAPLPCDVAEKCHSEAIPKSFIWWHKLTKFFLFLYWDAAPSEKYINFCG